MARVFLSYDRRDSNSAERVAAALDQAGHDVWWDRSIRGGRRFSKEIEDALAGAEAVVVLWSRNAVESDWVRDEAADGRDRGRLVPATLDGSLPPLGFRQYQTIDLAGAKKGIAPLLDAIAGLGAAEPGLVKQHSSAGPKRVDRRVVLAGLGASTTIAAGAIAYRRYDAKVQADPQLTALLDQAWQAWAQGTSDGNSQAIGLYRRATGQAPTSADAWGFLGCAYADRAHNWVPTSERDALWQRAQEAGRRALALDPRSAYGRAAIAYARPRRGNWGLMEREFRRAQDDQPGKWLIVYSLALLLGEVGRFAEAARLFGTLEGGAPTATQYFFHVQALWASGQLVEAERFLNEALDIFGTSSAIWWQRFDMLLTAGRPSAALAQLADQASRPADIGDQRLEQAAAVARAIASRNPAEIRSVEAMLRNSAFQSVGAASRGIEAAALLGNAKLAIEIAEALFFSRGRAVPDFVGSSGQNAQVTLDARSSRLLFLPTTKSLRTSPGFPSMLDELELTRYWRESKSLPDYARTKR